MSRVLIADDEQALLDVLSDAVRGLGHEVVCALDGEEALLLARAAAPDLVITDHMMPRRTGVQVLRALREDAALAKVPVILMSATRPRGAEEAWRYLAKPVHLVTFEQTIREVLRAEGDRPAPSRSGTTPAPATRAVEEMLEWIAHEIKTPLGAAQMASQLLWKRLEAIGDDSDRRHVSLVIRQLERMNTLVGSVLDAGRLADGRVTLDLRRRELAPFLEALVAEWRDLAPGHDFTLAAEPVAVTFDEERLRQVLNNLLSNAVKYGAPGDKVAIGVTLSPALVTISVRDHGRGIAAAEIPRIFDRFHQVAATRHGHGLGLYIASMLAKLHGGTLTVRSEEGQGTTFSLSLPRAR